jgi:formylmethanofuran dehydrogenase subunit D
LTVGNIEKKQLMGSDIQIPDSLWDRCVVALSSGTGMPGHRIRSFAIEAEQTEQAVSEAR